MIIMILIIMKGDDAMFVFIYFVPSLKRINPPSLASAATQNNPKSL